MMVDAPILGLDAFCQKPLVWLEDDGNACVRLQEMLVDLVDGNCVLEDQLKAVGCG